MPVDYERDVRQELRSRDSVVCVQQLPCGQELLLPLGCDLERRILIPFETTDDHWWMGVIRKDLCNWTPWIVSNIILIACLRIRDDRSRLAALLSRACVMLDRYLDVLPEDGGCDEGMGYWNLAGAMMLDCLEILERATGGRMSFRGDRKMINILSYPLHAYLGDGWCVNFADCDARPEISGERIARAGEMCGIPRLVAFGAAHRLSPLQHLSDTPQLWRLLNSLFHPLPAGPDPDPEAEVWLPDLQVRSLTRAGVTLVCKAGHNGENHNHNDVGSLIALADGEPEIVDAGNMTYTAKTFSGERYTLWNTRSMNHNLPLIGDAEQLPGADKRATDVRCLPDGLTLNMSGCYPEDLLLEECRRTVTLSESGTVTVSDRIRSAVSHPVTWVFMVRHRPVAGPDGIRIGKLLLKAPEDLITEYRELPITDPRMARSFPGSLWRLTLSLSPARDIAVDFRFVPVS